MRAIVVSEGTKILRLNQDLRGSGIKHQNYGHKNSDISQNVYKSDNKKHSKAISNTNF